VAIYNRAIKVDAPRRPVLAVDLVTVELAGTQAAPDRVLRDTQRGGGLGEGDTRVWRQRSAGVAITRAPGGAGVG